MSDVQRIHIDVPPGGALPGHPDYFQAQDGDVVSVVDGPTEDGEPRWGWKLSRADGRLKLEAGNFPSWDAADQAAREAFGDVPTYEGAE